VSEESRGEQRRAEERRGEERGVVFIIYRQTDTDRQPNGWTDSLAADVEPSKVKYIF